MDNAEDCKFWIQHYTRNGQGKQVAYWKRELKRVLKNG